MRLRVQNVDRLFGGVIASSLEFLSYAQPIPGEAVAWGLQRLSTAVCKYSVPVVCKTESGERAAIPSSKPAFQRGANTRSLPVSGRRSAFVVPEHSAQPDPTDDFTLAPGWVVPGRIPVPQHSVAQSLVRPFKMVVFEVF